MDPVKVVIFVAAFLLLLLLGKKLSSGGDSYAATLPPDAFRPEHAAVEEEDEPLNKPTLVGADLPFPVSLPPIERDADGKYNRPEFLNYYFDNIDLRTGPEDPESFCDDFFVEIRDIEHNHSMLYRFLVATPPGLQKVVAKERPPALYIEEQTIIVSRWDLPMILSVAVREIMKSYQHNSSVYTGEHALPDGDNNNG
jgi:hypothetical protein